MSDQLLLSGISVRDLGSQTEFKPWAKGAEAHAQHLLKKQACFLECPLPLRNKLEQRGKGAFLDPPFFASKKLLRGIVHGLPLSASILKFRIP